MAANRKHENNPKRLAQGLSKAWIMRAFRGKADSVCAEFGRDAGRTVGDEYQLHSSSWFCPSSSFPTRLGTAESKTAALGNAKSLAASAFEYRSLARSDVRSELGNPPAMQPVKLKSVFENPELAAGMPPAPARWKRALLGSAGIPACGFTEHPCFVFPERALQVSSKSEILSGEWLPDMDLNHDKQSQSLLCYRYTIGQTDVLHRLNLSIRESSRQTITCEAKQPRRGDISVVGDFQPNLSSVRSGICRPAGAESFSSSSNYKDFAPSGALN
jgi:hypothetical protein